MSDAYTNPPGKWEHGEGVGDQASNFTQAQILIYKMMTITLALCITYS